MSCRHTPVDLPDGERCCTTCGMVLGYDAVVQEAADAAHHTHRIPAANTTPLTIRDHAGRPVADAGAARRIQRMDSRTISTTARVRARSRMNMHGLCQRLGLPESVYQAAVPIHDKMAAANIQTGHTYAVLEAATVYAVCRHQSIPRTIHVVADMAAVRTRRLRAAARIILSDMPPPPPDAVSYIPGIAAMMDPPIPEPARRLAADMIRAADIQGRSPITVAAAALHQASGRPKTEVAAAAQINSVSVHNVARLLPGTTGGRPASGGRRCRTSLGPPPRGRIRGAGEIRMSGTD